MKSDNFQAKGTLMVSSKITGMSEGVGKFTYYSDGKISYEFDEHFFGDELLIGGHKSQIEEGRNWSTAGIPEQRDLKRYKIPIHKRLFYFFAGYDEVKGGLILPEFDMKLRRRQDIYFSGESIKFKLANGLVIIAIEDHDEMQESILGEFGRIILRENINGEEKYHYPDFVDGDYIHHTTQVDIKNFKFMGEHLLPLTIKWDYLNK